jgi:hypothetical protein
MFKKLFVASTILGISAISAMGCSSSDPVAKCHDVVDVTCDKLYSCSTGATLDAIKMLYGADAAACKTKLGDMTCKNAATNGGCPTGMSFDGSKADQCISDYKAQACGAQMAPASCSGSFCK